MSERRISVTLPSGQTVEGVEVQVDESTERRSEFKLQDGSVIRVKATILSAARLDGQYDPNGNPAYSVNIVPVVTTASAPERLRRKD